MSSLKVNADLLKPCTRNYLFLHESFSSKLQLFDLGIDRKTFFGEKRSPGIMPTSTEPLPFGEHRAVV
jgi:hypothetical protein